MNNSDAFDSENSLPFIMVIENNIVEVSRFFADFSEYSAETFLNKNIENLIKVLRVSPNINNVSDIDEKTDYFIFTKSLEVRFVNIEILMFGKEEKWIFREKAYSRLQDKFSYAYELLSENIIGVAIYSVPDLTLLKANQMYLDFLDIPLNLPEKTFGKSIYSFIPGYKGSDAEDILKNALISGKSQWLKEFMYDKFARGVTYWDELITPVKENGKVKYIITNTQEVTERVLNRKLLKENSKIIEQQNKELELVLDNLDGGITIINSDGGFKSANKRVKKWASSNETSKVASSSGTVKCYDLNGRELSRSELPIPRVLKGEKFEHYEMTMRTGDVERYVSLNGIPIYDDKGTFMMGVIVSKDITERVKQSRTIRQQKEFLEAVIENMSDSVLVFDKDGNYIMKNRDSLASLFAGQLKKVGDSYKSGIYYDLEGSELPFKDVPAVRVLKGEKIKEQIIYVNTPKGGRYLACSGTPLFDDNNKLSLGILSIHDVTELKMKTQIIKRQKDLLETILDNISDILFVYNKDGSIFLINREAKKVLKKFEEYKELGDTLKAMRHYDIRGNEIFKEDLPPYKALRGEKVTDVIHSAECGSKMSHYSTSYNAVYDEKGNIEYGVVSMHDITDLIDKEREAKQHKEKLEAIINSMSDGIFLGEKNSTITFLNNAAKKFFNSSDKITDAADIVMFNKCFYDIDGREISKEDMPGYRAMNNGGYNDYRLTIVHPDRKIYVSVNGSPVYDENGKAKAAVLCVRDISEYIKKEKDLEESQLKLLRAEREKNEILKNSMEMKDEFLSLISHELRTPLNVINAAVQAMELICNEELSEKAKGYIKVIRQNIYRQLRLVNNLLDITRVDAGRINIHKRNTDIVSLSKAITESVENYAFQKGINLTFQSSLSKKVIGIDEEKYERILLNLLSNAIKFTPRGKSITVKLYTIKNNVLIEVKDTGIGIPKDKMDIIFERFGQVDSSLSRQSEGAGIGLSLVKRLVEALGGSIAVKSKEGKGSTFTVQLLDEEIIDDNSLMPMLNLLDNHLVQIVTVEFSDIYF